MNQKRVMWAESALDLFRQVTGMLGEDDDEDAFSDLLADLMHVADACGYDFENALKWARIHYEAELEEEDDD
jgi:hypothetical protein